MYEPDRVICDVGLWLDSVRTATSIRFSEMGSERGSVSDAAGAIPRQLETSCELEGLSASGPQLNQH